MERYRKIFVLIVLVHISVGCRTEVIKKDVEEMRRSRTDSLPIPYPKYLDIFDEGHVNVRWDPVKISEDNPILGFKIKLWEDQKKLVRKYVDMDGQQVLVEKLVPIKKSFHVLPTWEPALQAVVPPDVFSVNFTVIVGEHYELRGQSYSVDGEGPLSNTYGFRIHTAEEEAEKEKREKEKQSE